MGSKGTTLQGSSGTNRRALTKAMRVNIFLTRKSNTWNLGVPQRCWESVPWFSVVLRILLMHGTVRNPIKESSKAQQRSEQPYASEPSLDGICELAGGLALLSTVLR